MKGEEEEGRVSFWWDTSSASLGVELTHLCVCNTWACKAAENFACRGSDHNSYSVPFSFPCPTAIRRLSGDVVL